MSLSFWIVDVFAESRFAGNQLAVFTDAGHLSSEQMQQIAKEINFSETTFILSSELRNGGYDVRIFTPAKELPFAGHPTLGTAFVIQQTIARQPVEQINLNLQVGQIPVNLHYEGAQPQVLWMKPNSPTFGESVTAEAIAPVLSLTPEDIDLRFPVQVVSTGVPFLIVPLKSLSALQKIKVNLDPLFTLVENLSAREIFVFCPETRNPENHFSARMFAHFLGIPEDPATGSANACFAGYLSQHEYLGSDEVDVCVEQGYEMGRPSLLRLKAQKQATAIQIEVGGRVIAIATGEFLVD